MTPAERHAAVLAALDDQIEQREFAADTYADQIGALRGRRRIVERHAPERANNGDVVCSRCLVDHGYPDNVEWPCEEFNDAAADLLPEEAR